MPPDVDNKALARQKRRRTRYVLHAFSVQVVVVVFGRDHVGPHARRAGSRLPSGAIRRNYPAGKRHSNIPSSLTTTLCSKEDEDVLKSYYLKNPKPDKTARLEIVTKVALGEKEVQVRPLILLHVTSVRVLANMHSLDLVSK